MLAEILEDVSIGAFDDDEKDDGAMHCMLVVAGYGGTLMNGETAKMLDGYDKSVLKNHRLFDCTVVKDKEVYVHAVLKSTGRTAAII
ncbi:MAG: hypothetical protein IJZ20_00095, partial [Clostridia bacterium]|nr:hypothetical protein [Clostridia bacterium]